MKVLFVPNRTGYISHGVPLVALSRLLPGTGFATAFLVAADAVEFFRLAGVEALPIAHDGLRTEMVAYHRYKPDIVIDDMSISTAVATQLTGLRRITLQRTGVFSGATPANPQHRHSGDFDFESISHVAALGIPRPAELRDLARAAAVIVPGVRSVEVLPGELQHDPRYFFSGPLVLPDFLFRDRGGEAATHCNAIDDFLERHAGVSIVYATFGNIAAAASPIKRALQELLSQGSAVISNIDIGSPGNLSSHYLFGTFLPMDRICSRAALMIHHGGSGTYHYPIVHNLPNITIGTRCHDRDDVATRLEELGASLHLPAAEDCPDLERRLLAAARQLLEPAHCARQQMQQSLAGLRQELRETSRAFRLQRVIEAASG